jgi:two-component system phosphate regulon sensor histidine kinase PhoR
MKMAAAVPIAGIAVVLATCAVLLIGGTSPWLTVAAALVWIASFWLAAPAPQATARVPSEGFQLTESRMRELIEHSAMPMLMLEGDRIIIANTAARETLGAHIVGQDARVALRHPTAVELLSRHSGGSATIQGLTGPRTSWQMSRQSMDERYSIIELINRSAEADISRAHTDFVANASHELRTPLSSIIGYVETLVEEGHAIDAKQASHFHETVLREARRLQSLVDDLMSLSRIEAEKHDQPRDQINLALLVPQASRDAAGVKRQGQLDLRIGHQPLMVRGDRQQLEQLVRNLVDNGLKYGAAKGQVTVSLDRDEQSSAVLTVRDEGEGIASEHIPHLTRRFYRTDPGRSRAAGGTGLGLAIVKHIVERHRGQLDIASRRGEGTCVTVVLPAAD